MKIDSTLTVIPGRREVASPESIFTCRGYGFRLSLALLSALSAGMTNF
jgi:hypothetical protein